MNLRDIIIRRAEIAPDTLAIKGPDANLTYGELNASAHAFAQALAQLGVRRGHRVGIWLDKSSCMVAAMQGVLRLRAIYVPLDPLSPASRIGTIMRDCEMQVLITTQQRSESMLSSDAWHLQRQQRLCIEHERTNLMWGNLVALSDAALAESGLDEAGSLALVESEPDEREIAYILYTSGSTGKPKGVCISNRNALAFTEWALDMLKATPHDRFANHAPFHFDLSVLDLYVAFAAGATVFLIPDVVSSIPQYLVDCIVREQLTVWYSVPSVLVLMMEYGGLLGLDVLPLRAILFAGEPFPLKPLKKLYQRWSQSVRMLNLYGPTETNVCTYYELVHLPEEQQEPLPIGKPCSGDRVWAQKKDGTIAQPGEEGELMVAGPTVMVGYWGKPEHGEKPYATGDLVQLQEDGNYRYLGRRDRMVKIRGHRVELDEIEIALEQHHAIAEVAVIVVGKELESRLVAFAVAAISDVPPLLDMKRHCAEHLPRSMIIDEIHWVLALPRTRNGKIDRLSLAQRSIQYATR